MGGDYQRQKIVAREVVITDDPAARRWSAVYVREENQGTISNSRWLALCRKRRDFWSCRSKTKMKNCGVNGKIR